MDDAGLVCVVQPFGDFHTQGNRFPCIGLSAQTPINQRAAVNEIGDDKIGVVMTADFQNIYHVGVVDLRDGASLTQKDLRVP